MKAGRYFDNPTAGLSAMHREAFEHKRQGKGTQQQQHQRGYHSSSRQGSSVVEEVVSERGGGVLAVAPPCSVASVVHSLTDYITLDEQLCQITALPEGVDLSQYVAGGSAPLLDRACPHAPIRLTRLVGEEERELAIQNSLKYFHTSLHAQMRPVTEHELDAYGHIYFYPLLPPDHVWAFPYDEIPGGTVEAKAMTHMILNVLDPRYVAGGVMWCDVM